MRRRSRSPSASGRDGTAGWRGPSASGAYADAERLDVADPEGWEVWRFTMPWPDEVPGRMLAVGSSVEVLEPPDIRARVAATAARIVERYRAVEAGETD